MKAHGTGRTVWQTVHTASDNAARWRTLQRISDGSPEATRFTGSNGASNTSLVYARVYSTLVTDQPVALVFRCVVNVEVLLALGSAPQGPNALEQVAKHACTVMAADATAASVWPCVLRIVRGHQPINTLNVD